MSSPSSPAARKWFRWLWGFVVLVALIGFVPVVMDRNYGNLILTAEWVKRVHVAGLIFAGLYTALSGVLLFHGMRLTHRAKTVPLWANIVTGAIMPILFFMIGYLTIVAAYPAVTAAWSSDRVSYTVTVREVSPSGSRGCRVRIELQDMPFLFDLVCVRNRQAREVFEPGQEIVIVGEGTQHALFADNIRY